MKIDKEDSVVEKQNGALAHKVARGTFWVAASSIFGEGLYFLRTIILVRLLNPVDFGLMGIAAAVIDVFRRFSEMGVGEALVQKKEVNKPILNTAWIMAVIRGISLFILLYLCSSLVSRFYNNEQLNNILKFISLSFLFNGLASAGVFVFVKELNFKNRVIFQQANSISNTVVSVTLAIIFKNVWALVIGYVVGSLVGLFVSYRLHPFRPSLKFDLNASKGLFNFGKYVFASGILMFLFIGGPNALVGKILGLDSLGFYVIAFNIANIPVTSVTHLVSEVAFPAYAKLQDDLPRLRQGYLKVTRLVAFLSTPIAGGIFMLIPEFVQIFLGARWMPIVLPVRILCILGFSRSIYSTVGPVFLGVGRPDLQFKFLVLNFTLLAILFFPLTINAGIVGTSIAYALVSIISIFFIIRINYKLIKLSVEKIQFFKILFFPLAATFLMCFSISLVKLFFVHSLIISFSISILVGGSCYILILYILDKYFGYGFIDTIRFAINSYKNRGIAA